MYKGEPALTNLSSHILASVVANPRSASLAQPFASMRMLAGLISLCIKSNYLIPRYPSTICPNIFIACYVLRGCLFLLCFFMILSRLSMHSSVTITIYFLVYIIYLRWMMYLAFLSSFKQLISFFRNLFYTLDFIFYTSITFRATISSE